METLIRRKSATSEVRHLRDLQNSKLIRGNILDS